MHEKLFIPTKLKIGYNERNDTYTKKLAYVIYYDQKNVLRQEKSWEGWRDKQITPNDYLNEPTEGFVLNKGVGGQRESYGWNARNEYIRVYDPRGFEFEIPISNLLFILAECDSFKGKGLSGKFVYAWAGSQLVLLPVTSNEYKTSTEFTGLQSCKVSTKKLVEGGTYESKELEKLVYLGRFNTFSYYDWRESDYELTISMKTHIFFDTKAKRDSLSFCKNVSNIAKEISKDPVENFAELIDKVTSCKNSGKITDVNTSKIATLSPETNKQKGDTYILRDNLFKEKDGIFTMYRLTFDEVDSYKYNPTNDRYSYRNYKRSKIYSLQPLKTFQFVDGEIVILSNTPKTADVFSEQEINGMDFLKIEIRIKNAKNKLHLVNIL